MAWEDVGLPGIRTLDDSLGVYIHVPFCKAKCRYCDFNSYPALEHLIPKYVRALISEVNTRTSALPGKANVPTIYFGGGTPSLLPAGQVAEILDACRASFSVAPAAEISMEANPGTVTMPLLRKLRDVGVNRLSLGVQSFDNPELRLLGRIHDSAQANEAFDFARKAGFAYINLDLIYGLPAQSLTAWRENLEQALALQPEHLSLYALTMEDDTPMGQDLAAGRIPAPDPDLAADMYLAAEDMLDISGYQHYEISNWAKPGMTCRHNLVYWKNQPYLGFGAGAHSCFMGKRFCNVGSPAQYVEKIENNAGQPGWKGDALAGSETISEDLERAETVILGLRLVDGIRPGEFFERYGVTLETLYQPQIDEMVAAGLLEVGEDRMRLTQRGRLLGNEVFQRFLPASGLTGSRSVD